MKSSFFFDLIKHYCDKNDLISIFSFCFSLIPFFLIGLYTLWFFMTQQIEPALIICAHIIVESINKWLKTLFKIPRPVEFDDGLTNKIGGKYGMPSSHAQFVGLSVSYLNCVLYFKLKKINKQTKIYLSISLILISFFILYSRVYLLYHTIQQVIAGLDVGIILGFLFYIIRFELTNFGFIDKICSLKIIKSFNIKDTFYS